MGVAGRLQFGGLDPHSQPASPFEYSALPDQHLPHEFKPNCKLQNVKGEEHKATRRTNGPRATHSEFALLNLHFAICNLQFAI
jgi:hypothetical protein